MPIPPIAGMTHLTAKAKDQAHYEALVRVESAENAWTRHERKWHCQPPTIRGLSPLRVRGHRNDSAATTEHDELLTELQKAREALK